MTRAKWTTEEVVKRVRGEEGTKVKLVMSRPAKDAVHDEPTDVTFEITREKINYPNIKSEKIGDVGYIRLGQFNAKAADDIEKAVEDLTKKGAKGFVLDLRDNPGGLLDQAVDVTSLFVDDGVIVRVDERDKPEQVLNATGNKITDAPMVVLINGNSASASEIVAGALQDYGRAVLVGEKSFGKGSVQTIEELPDGGAVKFTIAHYLTPKKRVINGIGLTPDVVVVMDREKQMEKATDTQLQKALAGGQGERAEGQQVARGEPAPTRRAELLVVVLVVEHDDRLEVRDRLLQTAGADASVRRRRPRPQAVRRAAASSRRQRA